jgi:hypothetical protein
LVLVFGFGRQIAANAAEARLRVRRDAAVVRVAPEAFRGRHHERRAPVYVYQYYQPGYYPYNPPFTVVSPYASYYPYYIPPTVVANLPYFCVLHQNGWVSRAGFLDHIAGTHKVPLEIAASACQDGVESCLFPGY